MAAFVLAAGAGVGAFGADLGPPRLWIPSAAERTTNARSQKPLGRPTSLGRPVLTTTPVAPYRSPDATFAWRAQAGWSWPPRTTFVCSLDGHAWAACRTSTTYRGLRSGTHVFRVRAELRRRRSQANRFSWTIELATPAPAEPRITSQPSTATTSTVASFTFEADGAAGFACRLDQAQWQPCASPVTYIGLAPGTHQFCVRAVSSDGISGPSACTGWVQAPLAGSPAPPPPVPPAPDLFAISGDLPTLLGPGTGGPLPLTVSNPNDFDLQVSGLVVSVQPGSSRPGCDGPANLQVTQSNTASGTVSILVPAHGSVTLPAQGATAPELAMLNLTTNQDSCKGAVFTLAFSGSSTRAG